VTIPDKDGINNHIWRQ